MLLKEYDARLIAVENKMNKDNNHYYFGVRSRKFKKIALSNVENRFINKDPTGCYEFSGETECFMNIFTLP